MSLNDGTIFLGRDRKWSSDHVLCPFSLTHLLLSMESIVVSLEFKCVMCAIVVRLESLGKRKVRNQRD